MASMVIFQDPVTGTQFFGYGIALSGLVYYKLGSDKLKEYMSQGARQWNEYGQTNPAMKKVVIGFTALVVLLIVAGGAVQLLPEQYNPIPAAAQSGRGH